MLSLGSNPLKKIILLGVNARAARIAAPLPHAPESFAECGVSEWLNESAAVHLADCCPGPVSSMRDAAEAGLNFLRSFGGPAQPRSAGRVLSATAPHFGCDGHN